MTRHAVGVQAYVCRPEAGGAKVWTFQGPAADLFAGPTHVGHHDPGPRWTYRDGSMVTGEVTAKAAGTTAGDIPWLRPAVVRHGGRGASDNVHVVLRSETKGGLLQGACNKADAAQDVPYEAD